ncbi:hypothetical protein IAD21_00531 [Abditibacteriota bacterium]|nr:hypothetical protein IAD21_00531 [Abditibacteriota bacterium]
MANRLTFMPSPLDSSPLPSAPVSPPDAQTLTISEVAHLLRVNVETVRRLAEKGEIAGAFKVGGSWRFNRTSSYYVFSPIPNAKT